MPVSRKPRRNFTTDQKVAILRRHHIERGARWEADVDAATPGSAVVAPLATGGLAVYTKRHGPRASVDTAWISASVRSAATSRGQPTSKNHISPTGSAATRASAGPSAASCSGVRYCRRQSATVSMIAMQSCGAELAVRLRPGMRKAIPLGMWGENGVEAE